MARIPRTSNARSIRIWPGMDKDDTPGGGTVTLAATGYSDPVKGAGQHSTGTIQLIWVGAAGSLIGTFSLQACLVQDPDLATDTDWVSLTSPTVNGTALAVASNDGNTLVAIPVTLLVEWYRIKFTFTSGTGSIRAFAKSPSDR